MEALFNAMDGLRVLIDKSVLHIAGDLSVVSDCLDFELAPLRRLVVLAASSDGSSDLAAVFIHISDVDDHRPQFSTGRKEAIIAEGAPRGTVVARLPPIFDQDHTRNHRLLALCKNDSQ